MNISYKENGKDINYAEVLRILQDTLPVRRNWDQKKTEEAFAGSSYTIAAYDGDKVAAAARVLSDGYEWTLLGDLVVDKKYQNQGIGTELVKRILERFKGHEIFTYVYREELSFFEQFGFRRSKNAFTYSGENDEALESDLLEQGFFLPLGYQYETEFYPVVGNFPKGKKSKAKAEDIRYTVSNENIDYVRVNEILSLAFGGHERDLNVTRGAFENSQYFSFAFDGEKLIGCARAVSDKVSQGFILNVAVDPNYQGIHLGWNIVTKLSEQMKGQNIFLNTHPGGVGFYNRKGFRRNKTALLYPANPNMPEEIAKGFVLPRGYRFVDEITY